MKDFIFLNCLFLTIGDNNYEWDRGDRGDRGDRPERGERGRGRGRGRGGRGGSRPSGDNAEVTNGDEDKKAPVTYVPPEPTTNEQEIFSSSISSGINFDKFDCIAVKVCVIFIIIIIIDNLL